jgi:hypothetical protein
VRYSTSCNVVADVVVVEVLATATSDSRCCRTDGTRSAPRTTVNNLGVAVAVVAAVVAVAVAVVAADVVEIEVLSNTELNWSMSLVDAVGDGCCVELCVAASSFVIGTYRYATRSDASRQRVATSSHTYPHQCPCRCIPCELVARADILVVPLSNVVVVVRQMQKVQRILGSQQPCHRTLCIQHEPNAAMSTPRG